MQSIFSSGIAEAEPQSAYDAAYYGQHYGQSDSERDLAQAQAITTAVGLGYNDRIIDFGCGTGAMVAAYNKVGYPTIGLDSSPDAIENAVPDARGYIHRLGGRGGFSLSDFPNDAADLAMAKDVFEHIPKGELPDTVEQLLCIGRKVLAVIPIANERGDFVCGVYEQDPTHVTRLTRNEWLGFFSCMTAIDLIDLTPQLRPSTRQANGTMSLLLKESAKDREKLMRGRAFRPTFWGPRPRRFTADFASLYGAER